MRFIDRLSLCSHFQYITMYVDRIYRICMIVIFNIIHVYVYIPVRTIFIAIFNTSTLDFVPAKPCEDHLADQGHVAELRQQLDEP